MESQDQVFEQSNLDQPQEVNGDEAGKQSQTFEVNWQTLTADKLLENYTKLQAEYTKARQEVSETKKNSELTPEDKAAIDFIKNHWFVTKEELEGMSKRQTQELHLKDLLAANPDLLPFENAIKEIWLNKNMAFEDVIQHYGFKAKDKLARARSQWDIKWMPEKKEKSISEMTLAEYEQYKAKKWWNTKNRWYFS